MARRNLWKSPQPAPATPPPPPPPSPPAAAAPEPPVAVPARKPKAAAETATVAPIAAPVVVVPPAAEAEPVVTPAAPVNLPRPIDHLRMAKSKTRTRQWEKENTGVSYRGVPREVTQAMKTLSVNLGVTVDDLARAFLQHSWQAWQRGQLTLQPQVHEGRWTIVDQTTPGALPLPAKVAKPRRSKTDKAWETVVKFRGVPAELREGVRQAAEQLHVQVGAVAAAFLRQGLEDYNAGKLTLAVLPTPGRLTLK